MGRFNLLEEPWITVMVDEKGQTKDVSLIELFENAHHYKCLAGEMKAQDFAVLRVLLSVLHTVFSRLDADGNSYEYFDLDDRFQVKEDVDEDDYEDYEDDVLTTWEEIWENRQFPSIIRQYLEMWKDHFNLLDDKFPFFQVTKEEIEKFLVEGKNPSPVSGKNINRLISESGNKAALFTPRYENKHNKEILNESEMIRWLLTCQGYIGLSDKTIFGKEKYKASKGWLFDLGGIYLEGDNLFETLMLNYNVGDQGDKGSMQKPCWEHSGRENIQRLMAETPIRNLAELYTNWSRAIFLDPATDFSKPVQIGIVKVPEINHKDNFLEPMTIWRKNESGENKGTSTPKKHILEQAMWRSYGLLVSANSTEDIKGECPAPTPGIIKWFQNRKKYLVSDRITINSISMQDDGNATSWVPVNEISDSLNLNQILLTDVATNGWILRITDTVEDTKYVIDKLYRNFLNEIKFIRNISLDTFVSQKMEEVYFQIDQPFRLWLASIDGDSDKDLTLLEWRRQLKRILLMEAEMLLENASARDFLGKNDEKKTSNIIMAYKVFVAQLNKYLKIEEDVNGGE